MTWRPSIPTTGSFVLRRARVPVSILADPVGSERDGCVAADILIEAGRIVAIDSSIETDQPAIELDNGLVWPSPVELHTHLDKGHIVSRAHNPDGTVTGAVGAVRADRAANWSGEDIARRFEFSLRSAFAHGTAAIRTHIDSYFPQARISWPVFAKMRDSWAGRVDLQAVALTTLDAWEGEPGRELADLVAATGGILGGVTREADDPALLTPERISADLDIVCRLATERGLDLDFHVDETSRLEPNLLDLIARAVLRNGFRGRVVCGHCCSLSLRSPESMTETIARVRDAGIAIVSLPMVNLHLQDRGKGRTPRWRGVTPVQELAAAGVPVVAASDNTRDPFYTFGDLDGVEVFRETVRICHLDAAPFTWLPMVTRTPADVMGLLDRGHLKPGAPADLVLFRARTSNELLARPQSDRVVLRSGRAIDTSLPDYRDLD